MDRLEAKAQTRENNKVSLLDQLKKLDEQQEKIKEQRDKLLESAKAEALGKAEEALKELNAIGPFNYRLVEGDGGKRKGGRTGITRKRNPNAPCGVCNFVTDPPHDGRLHRSQGKNKKPFTAKELDELNLKKKG